MQNGRVLIIDDSITIRAMVEQLLSKQGLWSEIAVASDVPAARRLIETFKPTIITLDLNMPGINGLAMLEELRFYPHAPVVVVSSSTKEGSEEEKAALAAGADACFDKSRILSDSAKFVKLLVKTALAERRTVEKRPGFDHRDHILA
jgi:two-component system chemotaxis response regulator CheB